jgi:hypothetical protein
MFAPYSTTFGRSRNLSESPAKDSFMEELQDKIKTRNAASAPYLPNYSAAVSNPNKNRFAILEIKGEEEAEEKTAVSKAAPGKAGLELSKDDPSEKDAVDLVKKGEENAKKEQEEQEVAAGEEPSSKFSVLSPELVAQRQQHCNDLFTLCLYAKSRVDTVRGRRMMECKNLTANQRRLGQFYAQLAQEMVEKEKESVQLSYLSSFFWNPQPEPKTVALLRTYQENMASGNFDLEEKFFEVSPELTEKYPDVLPVPSTFTLLQSLR